MNILRIAVKENWQWVSAYICIVVLLFGSVGGAVVFAQELTPEPVPPPTETPVGASEGLFQLALSEGGFVAIVVVLCVISAVLFAIYRFSSGKSLQQNELAYSLTRGALMAAMFFASKTDKTDLDNQGIDILARLMGFDTAELWKTIGGAPPSNPDEFQSETARRYWERRGEAEQVIDPDEV